MMFTSAHKHTHKRAHTQTYTDRVGSPFTRRAWQMVGAVRGVTLLSHSLRFKRTILRPGGAGNSEPPRGVVESSNRASIFVC
jgi:hypothetical protein